MVATDASSKAAGLAGLPSSLPRRLRVLELGCELFVATVPEQTDFYWIDRNRKTGVRLLGPVNFGRVLRRLWRGDYDLVVVGVPLVSPWHPRSFLTALRDWHVRAPA